MHEVDMLLSNFPIPGNREMLDEEVLRGFWRAATSINRTTYTSRNVPTAPVLVTILTALVKPVLSGDGEYFNYTRRVRKIELSCISRSAEAPAYMGGVNKINVITVNREQLDAVSLDLTDTDENTREFYEYDETATLLKIQETHGVKTIYCSTDNVLYVYTTQMSENFLYRVMAYYLTKVDPQIPEETIRLVVNGNALALKALFDYYTEGAYEEIQARKRAAEQETLLRLFAPNYTETEKMIARLRNDVEYYEHELIERKEQLAQAMKKAFIEQYLEGMSAEEALAKAKEVWRKFGFEIEKVDSSNTNVILKDKTELKFWDEDAARTVMERITDTTTKKFFRDVLVEKKYTLYFINCTDISSTRYRDVSAGYGDTAIANPHHKYYDCWGDYRTTLDEGFRDPEVFYPTVKAAHAGLNMYDGAVINRFKLEIQTKEYETPQLKDNETGELISLKQWKERVKDETV